ncbi:MAG: hypothetical protein ACKOQR_20855, partial [Dolichospermum sp.]
SPQKLSLKVEVDDSPLYSLNKHLDLKYKHFKEVNRYFKNNPITPTVDNRKLDLFEQRLKELRKLTVQVQSSDGIAQTQVQQQHQQQKIKLDTSDLRKSIGEVKSVTEKAGKEIKLDTSDLRKLIGELKPTIEKASGKKSIFEQAILAPLKLAGSAILAPLKLAGSAISAPLKLAGSAISKVMEGALLGVGTPLGEEVGTGIKDGIANKSSQIIGSFQLISREIASGLIQEIINKTEKITQEIGKIFIEDDEILGKMLAEIKDEILTKIKDVANTIAGKDNIKLESASMRQETAVKNRRRQSMAERQFSEEYIGLIGNVQGIRKSKDALSAQGNKLQEHAKQVAGQMRKYQEELGIRELEDSAKSTAERLRGITSQMLSNPESDITSLQQESDSLQMSLSDIVKRISEIRQQAVLRLKNETDLFNELDKLSEKELQLNTELDKLSKKGLQFNTELESLGLIDKVKKLSRARLDKSANKTAQPDKSANKTAQPDKSANKTAQPEAYKLIYDEVLKYSNIDPSQAVMPELKVKPNMPAMVLGLYNYKTNQVKVSQAVYDAIESGKMDIEQFSAIAHELRHAVQFDFGRIKADVEGPAIKLISPSSEQLSQFATNIEGSVAHAVTRSGSENEPRIRAIEADAYAFADNVKDSIALSVRKALSVSQFQSQFGIGGGKTTLAMGVAQRDALLRLKKIIDLIDKYGVDVSSEISATLENTEAISASIKPLISKAADIELLSPSDIANLSNDITEGYTKTVELINKEVESFKNNAIAKIKQSQTQSIYAPTKEE